LHASDTEPAANTAYTLPVWLVLKDENIGFKNTLIHPNRNDLIKSYSTLKPCVFLCTFHEKQTTIKENALPASLLENTQSVLNYS
jgi:hypothetical protein